jgi:hypothetical protein
MSCICNEKCSKPIKSFQWRSSQKLSYSFIFVFLIALFRIESFAVINLRGVSTNKAIIYFCSLHMQLATFLNVSGS